MDVMYDYLVTPTYDRPKILADPLKEFREYQEYISGFNKTNFLQDPVIAKRTEEVLKPCLRPIGTAGRRVDKRVFVSYSRTESEFAVRLVNDVRQRLAGHDETVWMDTQQLTGGQSFLDVIQSEIRDRPVFVVIVSPDSMASHFVQDEIQLAVFMGLEDESPGEKLMAPVIYHTANMPTRLKMRNWVSFEAPYLYEESVNELMTVINQAR